MEIQCPSCQKKLSIGDQFAGQLVKCPACSGVFMAALAEHAAMPVQRPFPQARRLPTAAPKGTLPMTPPLGARLQAAAPDVIPFSSEPPSRPSYPHVPPLPKPAPSSQRVEFEEEPPGPPSDSKRSYTMRLCPDVLRWVGARRARRRLCPVVLQLGRSASRAGGAHDNLNVANFNFNLWNMAFGVGGRSFFGFSTCS